MDDNRGDPRVQYPRTYVLLPPSAHVGWAKAVINAIWDTHRPTIGGSADDAGVGSLDDRRVLAVNPDLWDDDLTAFFAEHYPDVVVWPIYADTPTELGEILSGSSVVSMSAPPGDGSGH